MDNFALLLIQIVACFSCSLLFYKLFGKVGAVVWSVICLIIANIEAVTVVQMGPWELGMGNVFFGATYLATDILSEFYGHKDANKCVLLSGVSMLVFSLIIQITLMFTPGASDNAHESLNTIFGFVPVISIASIILYVLSSIFDVWIFGKIREATGGKFLWIRNNVATMISVFIQSAIFAVIVYWGCFDIPFSEVLKMTGMATVVYFIIAACDTPFLYIARKITNKNLVKEIF